MVSRMKITKGGEPMNQLELEYARKRKNKTKADMAAAIGKSVG